MWRPESGVKNLCKICQLIENYDAIVEYRKCLPHVLFLRMCSSPNQELSHKLVGFLWRTERGEYGAT